MSPLTNRISVSGVDSISLMLSIATKTLDLSSFVKKIIDASTGHNLRGLSKTIQNLKIPVEFAASYHYGTTPLLWLSMLGGMQLFDNQRNLRQQVEFLGFFSGFS